MVVLTVLAIKFVHAYNLSLSGDTHRKVTLPYLNTHCPCVEWLPLIIVYVNVTCKFSPLLALHEHCLIFYSTVLKRKYQVYNFQDLVQYMLVTKDENNDDNTYIYVKW